MLKFFASLLGYDDYVRNPRSGRPEEPLSWQREPYFTWLAWVAAIIGIVGETSYFLKWGVFDGSLGGAGICFAAIAFVRRRAFERKKQELAAALESYERAIGISVPI